MRFSSRSATKLQTLKDQNHMTRLTSNINYLSSIAITPAPFPSKSWLSCTLNDRNHRQKDNHAAGTYIWAPLNRSGRTSTFKYDAAK